MSDTTGGKRAEIQMSSAVPTLLVADVGSTARWYAEHLGFQVAGTFPDDEPYSYASLRREGVEIMLLGLADYQKPDLTARQPEGLWAMWSGARRVRSIGTEPLQPRP